MFKVRMNRFFAVIAVLFCIGSNVSAEVKFSGAGSERVVVNSETFKLKIDFSTAKQYYLDKSHWGNEDDEKTMFKLIVGGCQVKIYAENCPIEENKMHIVFEEGSGICLANLDDENNVGTKNLFNAVVSKNAITFERPQKDTYHTWDGNFPCNIQFDKSSVPGRYVVDVSLSGPNIAPQLDTIIDGDLFTTTPVPTTTSSNAISTTVMTLSSPQCEDRGLAPWLIGLIVAVIVLALLIIVLCVITFCCYRRLQKDKTQVVPNSEHTTVKSTINTAPGPLIKETNQYGPDMMYFGRNATPVDLNTKNQAANPAPQIVSPAPYTSPMQTPQ